MSVIIAAGRESKLRTEWELVWERAIHVNREKMAVPEEVKEFNKQVCSDFPVFLVCVHV